MSKHLTVEFLAQKNIFKTHTVSVGGKTLAEPVLGSAIHTLLKTAVSSVSEIPSHNIHIALYNGEVDNDAMRTAAKVFDSPSCTMGYDVESCFTKKCPKFSEYINTMRDKLDNATSENPFIFVAAFYTTEAYDEFCKLMADFKRDKNIYGAVVTLLYFDEKVPPFAAASYTWKAAFTPYLMLPLNGKSPDAVIGNRAKEDIDQRTTNTFAYRMYSLIKVTAGITASIVS